MPRSSAFCGRRLLAAVAGDKAPAAAKVVDGKLAVVRATAAADVLLRHGEVRDVLGRKDGRGAVGAGAIASEQGRTVGAHAAGDVGTHGMNAGELLKCTQRGVGHKGAALNDYLAADLLGVAQLNDLEQGILDDGIGQTGRDVAHRGAFLLRLLDARVHKDRAAAAQIDRGWHGWRIGERAHAMFIDTAKLSIKLPQPDEQASLSMMCSITPSLTRRHFMSWPPMSKMNSRRAGTPCAAQVRNGLDFARVGLEGLDEQRLAVARGGHVADGAARGNVVVEIGMMTLAVPRISPLLLPYQVCSSWPSSPTSAAFMVVEPASIPMNTRPV